ncbi:hypothetical protein Bbelb_063560 [Branchiostoma belcheri]|nr:hypothetical protein Bbelb_063560 [Branchiostoma belcheri]
MQLTDQNKTKVTEAGTCRKSHSSHLFTAPRPGPDRYFLHASRPYPPVPYARRFCTALPTRHTEWFPIDRSPLAVKKRQKSGPTEPAARTEPYCINIRPVVLYFLPDVAVLRCQRAHRCVTTSIAFSQAQARLGAQRTPDWTLHVHGEWSDAGWVSGLVETSSTVLRDNLQSSTKTH